MMGLGKLLKELISNFHPINVSPTTNIKNLNITIPINGREYKVEKGILIATDKPAENIQLEIDKLGFLRPVINGTSLEGIADSKSQNVNMLDKDQKVFTRSDISETQLALLNTDCEHERIIKKLKPILQAAGHSKDMGALLSASAIIENEDKKEDYKLCKLLHQRFNTCYGKRGAMIYNLFRSDILRIEVLGHLNNLSNIYDKDKKVVAMHFLIYWDSILDIGYPTACFVKEEDRKTNINKEIRWRFKKGAKRIYIYSRTKHRNTNILKWCKEIAADGGYSCKAFKPYQLGFTPAIKIRVTAK